MTGCQRLLAFKMGTTKYPITQEVNKTRMINETHGYEYLDVIIVGYGLYSNAELLAMQQEAITTQLELLGNSTIRRNADLKNTLGNGGNIIIR